MKIPPPRFVEFSSLQFTGQKKNIYIYNVSYSKEKMYFIIPNMLFQTVNTHAKPQEILPVLESHLHIIVIIAVMSPPPDQATCTQQD